MYQTRHIFCSKSSEAATSSCHCTQPGVTQHQLTCCQKHMPRSICWSPRKKMSREGTCCWARHLWKTLKMKTFHQNISKQDFFFLYPIYPPAKQASNSHHTIPPAQRAQKDIVRARPFFGLCPSSAVSAALWADWRSKCWWCTSPPSPPHWKNVSSPFTVWKIS